MPKCGGDIVSIILGFRLSNTPNPSATHRPSQRPHRAPAWVTLRTTTAIHPIPPLRPPKTAATATGFRGHPTIKTCLHQTPPYKKKTEKKHQSEREQQAETRKVSFNTVGRSQSFRASEPGVSSRGVQSVELDGEALVDSRSAYIDPVRFKDESPHQDGSASSNQVRAKTVVPAKTEAPPDLAVAEVVAAAADEVGRVETSSAAPDMAVLVDERLVVVGEGWHVAKALLDVGWGASGAICDFVGELLGDADASIHVGSYGEPPSHGYTVSIETYPPSTGVGDPSNNDRDSSSSSSSSSTLPEPRGDGDGTHDQSRRVPSSASIENGFEPPLDADDSEGARNDDGDAADRTRIVPAPPPARATPSPSPSCTRTTNLLLLRLGNTPSGGGGGLATNDLGPRIRFLFALPSSSYPDLATRLADVLAATVDAQRAAALTELVAVDALGATAVVRAFRKTAGERLRRRGGGGGVWWRRGCGAPEPGEAIATVPEASEGEGMGVTSCGPPTVALGIRAKVAYQSVCFHFAKRCQDNPLDRTLFEKFHPGGAEGGSVDGLGWNGVDCIRLRRGMAGRVEIWNKKARAQKSAEERRSVGLVLFRVACRGKRLRWMNGTGC
ncbi:hypothetical protein DFJ73DRAFT_761496 [Zopfochytrium polystomum]|nr:hypothetical protein DFJ73DRAFT_761496 [Zopfochytrium polystomum]